MREKNQQLQCKWLGREKGWRALKEDDGTGLQSRVVIATVKLT